MSQQQQMKVYSFNSPGQVEPGSLLLQLSWDQTSYNCLHMQNHIGLWNQRTDRALSVLIPHHFRHSLAMHIDTGRKDVAKLQEQQTAVGATDCLWTHRHGAGADCGTPLDLCAFGFLPIVWAALWHCWGQWSPLWKEWWQRWAWLHKGTILAVKDNRCYNKPLILDLLLLLLQIHELNEPHHNMIDLTTASIFALLPREPEKKQTVNICSELKAVKATCVRPSESLNSKIMKIFNLCSPQRSLGSQFDGQAPASQSPVHHITRSPSVHSSDVTSCLLLSCSQSRKRDNFPSMLETGSICMLPSSSWCLAPRVSVPLGASLLLKVEGGEVTFTERAGRDSANVELKVWLNCSHWVACCLTNLLWCLLGCHQYINWAFVSCVSRSDISCTIWNYPAQSAGCSTLSQTATPVTSHLSLQTPVQCTGPPGGGTWRQSTEPHPGPVRMWGHPSVKGKASLI